MHPQNYTATHTLTFIHVQMFLAQSAGATKYTDRISAEGVKLPCNKGPGLDIEKSDGEASLMRNAEYPFIAITPKSTLARNGTTW